MQTEVSSLDLPPPLRDPVEQGLVADLLADAPAAGHQEDVERRAVVQGVVGDDPEPARGDDDAFLLRDHHHLEGRL